MNSNESPKELPKELAEELLGTPAVNAQPLTWMRALFARLSIHYGASWHNKWSHLPDIGLAHQHWANKLGGFSGEAIAYALKHLPDSPPNADTFRDICRHAPRDDGWLRLKEHFKRTPESDRIAEKVRAELMARLSKLPQKEGGK